MTVQIFQAAASALLVIALMFGIGLEVEGSDFARLARRPTRLLAGVLVNVVAVPLFAFALGTLLALPAPVVVGLLLCAAAPGGPAAVLFANLARSDLPLTAAMTIGLPMLGLVSTPGTLALLLDLPPEASVPVGPMVGSLLVLQVIPMAAGMGLRSRDADRATALARISRGVANAILAGFALVMLVLKGDVLGGMTPATWLAFGALSGAATGLGYLAGLPGRDTARSGAIVGVSRNIAVAIMLSSTFFADPLVDATVLSYGLVSFVLPVGLGLWWRRSAPLAVSVAPPGP